MSILSNNLVFQETEDPGAAVPGSEAGVGVARATQWLSVSAETLKKNAMPHGVTERIKGFGTDQLLGTVPGKKEMPRVQ